MTRSSSPPLTGHFAVWVTVWVRQICYPKIRTNKRENRRKSHDFHRFGGASGRTWTGDLLITNSRKAIKTTIFRCFQHFLLGNQCSLRILFPLFPSAHFAVWVSVWVKPENPAQKLRRSNQRLREEHLCRGLAAYWLFRCPTNHQIEIFLQRNLVSKHLATPLHGLCIRVLPLNFQGPSRLAHDPFNLVRTHSNLPANKFQNQYNSKCSWMQAADLMPLSVWTVAIFCHRKNFQNRLFKTRFSVGLNRGIFSERREQATQARKCKWSVNFLKRASKNRGPVAYTVRGFFEGTPLKTQKSVGLNRGSYCWTKNVFPTELKGFRRRVTKTAFCVGLNRGMFWTAKIFPNFLKTGCQNCDFYPYQ